MPVNTQLRKIDGGKQRKAPRQHQAEVADLLVGYLEQLGIDRVFGIPGGAIEPLYNALARSARAGGPRPVVARHESGAAFMADGYARETGKLGVCCATSGPGATNLITGVACAYENEIPLLVITGQPALPSFGKRAFQDSSCTGVNIVGMFQHCTRYNSFVSHPDQLEQKLVNAIMMAHRSPRGPVHLSIPLDVLRARSRTATPSYELAPLLRQPSLLDDQAIVELRDLALAARRTVLLIGAGAGEAISEILEFATRINAQFVTTPDAKGLVNPSHPLYCGVFGFAGHQIARNTLTAPDVDLVVAIGSSLGEWNSSCWSDSILNNRLVHIDASEEHLSRSPMARLHVRGRVSAVFERLIALLGEDRALKTLQADAMPQVSWNPREVCDQKAKYESGDTPIKPQRLMRELGLRFPPTSRFFADTGNSVAWATHYLHPFDRRVAERRSASAGRPRQGRRLGGNNRLRVTMDFASMGWAIGAAVGTASADARYPVVCVTGDGSFLMNGQEISVAVAEKLCVIFVILNDAALGMIKHGQRLTGAEQIGYQLPTVDFAAMARAMGAEAHTIRSPEDFDHLDIDAMCKRAGPTLLDVHIDPEEIPPMGVRIGALKAPE